MGLPRAVPDLGAGGDGEQEERPSCSLVPLTRGREEGATDLPGLRAQGEVALAGKTVWDWRFIASCCFGHRGFCMVGESGIVNR
ncbi:UNVERIFIED_CONTAM: hypothetical protein K2H54_040643 [Gekko kuhli]